MIRRSAVAILVLAAAGGCMRKKTAVTAMNVGPGRAATTEPTTTEYRTSDTGPSTEPVVTVTPPMPATGPTAPPPAWPPIAAQSPTTMPSTGPVTAVSTTPAATANLGKAGPTKNMVKTKPFIAGFASRETDPARIAGNRPSTLVREHASPASPVPLSEFARQPVHKFADFKLSRDLTSDQVQQLFGVPAQIAGIDEPWLVYRLPNETELWLRFVPAEHGTLDAADVVYGAEEGYVRKRVFPK